VWGKSDQVVEVPEGLEQGNVAAEAVGKQAARGGLADAAGKGDHRPPQSRRIAAAMSP
jgi:hypothetical protein